MKRLLYLVALSLMALLLYIPAAGAQQYQTQQGQTQQGQPQQGQAQQGGQNVTVMMQDNYFSPANITVPVGTTVTWVQSGNNPHTTTSYDGLWDSGILPGGSGQSFSFTFNQPGTYTYFCRPHEAQGMVGSVTVTGGGAGGGGGGGAGGGAGGGGAGAAGGAGGTAVAAQQPGGGTAAAAQQPAALPRSSGPSLVLTAAALSLVGAAALGGWTVLKRRSLS